MAAEDMVIFTRTFDFLTWLLPVTNNFPRAHRHTFSRRLLDAAFDLREFLEEANLRRGSARLERLVRSDEALARVRVYLWLTDYAHRRDAENAEVFVFFAHRETTMGKNNLPLREKFSSAY